MKDVTNKIANTVILIGRAVQLMIMDVKTFKTDDVVIFILNVRLTNHFQYHSQFIESDNVMW